MADIMLNALRVDPFRNAFAPFAAAAHPVYQQPVKETGEQRAYEEADDNVKSLPPGQLRKPILQFLFDTH
jgi:hypothetical protein